MAFPSGDEPACRWRPEKRGEPGGPLVEPEELRKQVRHKYREVVGVDMTPEMLDKATATAASLGASQVEFGGASGERNARAYEVFGYAFLAYRPT